MPVMSAGISSLSCAATVAGSCLVKVTMNQNVDPTPTSLSTPILPPMSSTSRLEIESPSPVPPKRLVVEESAWVNAAKSPSTLSGGMPMPVSRTVNRTVAVVGVSDSSATSIVTSPSSVNLIAVPMRLTKPWRRRPGSPHNDDGTSGSTSIASSRPFSWARNAGRSIASSRVVRRSKSSVSISSLPASILEKSRMSLIRASKASPLFLMVSR